MLQQQRSPIEDHHVHIVSPQVGGHLVQKRQLLSRAFLGSRLACQQDGNVHIA